MALGDPDRPGSPRPRKPNQEARPELHWGDSATCRQVNMVLYLTPKAGLQAVGAYGFVDKETRWRGWR